VNDDQLRAIAKKDAINAAQKIESDRAWNRLKDLNQEMLLLPVADRRKRWNEYYERVKQLASGGEKSRR
jgi:hypothetical protein